MQTPASGLKFCGERARVAYVRLAHAASRVILAGKCDLHFFRTSKESSHVAK